MHVYFKNFAHDAQTTSLASFYTNIIENNAEGNEQRRQRGCEASRRQSKFSNSLWLMKQLVFIK
jgi:hypothetical protein